jgi:osmotically-inducible protein OsmY
MKSPKSTLRSLCGVAIFSLMPAFAFAQGATPATTNADNTAVNARDAHSDTVKSTDQPNNRADVQLAASVRQAIINDRSLSMSAHNVKLVASAGIVTLRGPVSTEQERARVVEIASKVSGVARIDNQLEVTHH